MEPAIGLGLSFKHIKAAPTAVERSKRIATMAAFLTTSGTAAANFNTVTNSGLGATVASHISEIREALKVRGGWAWSSGIVLKFQDFKTIFTPLETPNSKINMYREQFYLKSKIVVENIFHEQSCHRYLQGSKRRAIKVGSSSYFATNQLNIVAAFGWTCLGIEVVSVTILFPLYLFQRSERI